MQTQPEFPTGNKEKEIVSLLFVFFVYPPIFVSIYCLSTSISLYLFFQSRLIPISFYLFVNPNSRLYLSNSFSLSQSILRISTYICFYHLSIHLYFFIPLCQSRLMPISINPIWFLSLIFIYPSVFIFISFLSTTITFYLLFIQIYMYLFQSLSPSLNLSFVHLPISFSIFLPIQVHGYVF